MNVVDPAFPLPEALAPNGGLCTPINTGLSKLEYTTIHIYCAYVTAGKVSQFGAEAMIKRAREEALILMGELS